MSFIARVFTAVALSSCGFCQLPSSRCDAEKISVDQCAFVTENLSAEAKISALLANAERTAPPIPQELFSATQQKTEHFHWGRALFESFTFLAIEQAYVVHDDYRWVTAENGVPLNHYWRDYKQSLRSWIDAGWNDGDPALYSYLGHPLQGAMTSFIQIQNDPRGRDLEIANTREYWKSRLRATIWNAVYSTQWNIGPLSELTVEKYGTQTRSPWNHNGTWPCTVPHQCYNGVGQVDLVTTPIGGLGWVLAEDWLDKTISRRVEGSTRNLFLIDFTRCALNPIRGGANILHGKRPWFRASRDAREVFLANQARKLHLTEAPPSSR